MYGARDMGGRDIRRRPAARAQARPRRRGDDEIFDAHLHYNGAEPYYSLDEVLGVLGQPRHRHLATSRPTTAPTR